MSADTNRQNVIKVHQRYNTSFPNDLGGYHRLTKIYIDLALEEGLSWLDAAKNQCDNALLIDGDDHVSHANLARIYLLQEKPRLAVLEAQLAFEIQPSSDYRELVDRAKYMLK
jgi:Tfp pilus assembly protein PilF